MVANFFDKIIKDKMIFSSYYYPSFSCFLCMFCPADYADGYGFCFSRSAFICEIRGLYSFAALPR